MGGLLAKPMADSFQKQQEFMMQSQKLQLERMLHQQNLMRERLMAMQIARARDQFLFIGAFMGVLIPVSGFGFIRTGSRAVLAPLLPLSFITAYIYDLGYGNKMNRIINDGETILSDHADKLCLPQGLPTFDEVENRRVAAKSEERFVPNEVFL